MTEGLPRLTTELLCQLWTDWLQDPQHQRFGQYIWNHTRFSLNEVNGILVYQEQDGEKVFTALSQYLDSIHS